MVSEIEIALLVVALALLFGAYWLIKAIKPLAVNAIVGVIILLIASWLGIGVEITLVAVLICAVAGIPGALLVILLAYLDIAFAGFVAMPL